MEHSQTETRIAVVEYDPESALQLKAILASNRARISIFTRGAAFLASADLKGFDCIVMDLSMPDIDGFPMMRSLATSVPVTPIVLITSHSPAIARAAELYANNVGLTVLAVLSRPFSSQEIRIALARFI